MAITSLSLDIFMCFDWADCAAVPPPPLKQSHISPKGETFSLLKQSKITGPQSNSEVRDVISFKVNEKQEL